MVPLLLLLLLLSAVVREGGIGGGGGGSVSSWKDTDLEKPSLTALVTSLLSPPLLELV